MTPSMLLPWLAAALFLAFAIFTLSNKESPKVAWRFAAALSAAFFAYSLFAVLSEGPLGFWTEHTRNSWGNQIWFDLLLAIGVSWALLQTRARAVQMNRLPWLIFIICTGCIGLLAMVSRLLYLEEQVAKSA